METRSSKVEFAELAQMQLDIVSGAPAAEPVFQTQDQSEERTAKPVAYNIMDHNARVSLVYDLLEIISTVFNAVPKKYRRVHEQRIPLIRAVGLLEKENNTTLLLRKKKIQSSLDNFFGCMSYLVSYALQSSRSRDGYDLDDFFLAWRLKRFVKRLTQLANTSPKREKDFDTVDRLIDFYHNEDGQNNSNFSFSSNFYFYAEYSLMSDDLLKLLSRPSLHATAMTQQQQTGVETKKKVEAWLAAMSSDLLAAYKDVETTLAEVTPLVSSSEDEYFMEQIHKEYLPQIFTALKNFDVQSVDFHDKETVVSESIKQFKIIQLGLQKILDGAVAKRVKAVTSQTEFLRQKVLGENALSLTPSEADKAVQISLDEANRVREELYKQHVAPILNTNREEYENKLAEEKSSLSMELAQERITHQKELGRQELALRQQLDQERIDFQRKLSEQKTEYKKELAELKNSLSKDTASPAYKQLTEEILTLQIALGDVEEKLALQKNASNRNKVTQPDELNEAKRLLETNYRGNQQNMSVVQAKYDALVAEIAEKTSGAPIDAEDYEAECLYEAMIARWTPEESADDDYPWF
jgi:hypothetical protein